MSRRYARYSEDEERYIRTHYARMSPERIAKKLDRPLAGIYEKAQAMGLRHGVPTGYVPIRSVVDDQPAVRNIARVAKRAGVLRQNRVGHKLLCVPEKWLDDYLGKRMSRAANDELARREGWYTVADIADALGRQRHKVGVDIGTRKGRLGKAMRAVKRIEGTFGRFYYEPGGTRLVLHRFGAQTYRRAA